MTLPNQGKRKIFDGRYEIISIVGRGADSVVYHARHVTDTSQEVAIKVLTNRGSTSSLTDQLRKEALTLVSCRHKYVVRLDDFHSIKDLCYLSMEYAPLGDLLKYTSTTNKRLSNEQAALFLRQALEALDFVHATGVIHRDLKPENILVINDKEIRIADFGLALLPGDDVALDDLRKGVGSFDYLAPEVLDGVRYDTLSDLYSLGVCFYEAVSGVHPFRNAPLAEQRNARLDDRITPLNVVAPSLPPHIAAVIASLIRFNSEERIQSASDAVKALANPEFRGITGFAEATTSKPSATPKPIKETISVTSTTGVTEPARVAPQTAPAPSSTDGSTARAVATTAATASVQVAEREPANSDTIVARPAQPTEKIDLERVKAIIAKDTQRRSIGTTNSTQAPDTDTPTSANQKPSSTTRELPQARTTHRSAPTSRSQLLPALWDRFSLLPTLTRSLLVAGSSALITISGLLAWHTLSGGSTTSKSTHSVTVTTDQTDSSTAETAQSIAREPSDPSATTGLKLPSGVYSGVVRGLLPGADIPIALISRPGDAGLVLALGVEGWVPTAGSVPAGERAEDTATFRSNGLVLSFERELSSTEITGTVTDMVTGDTGVWIVTKHS